ncbi:hypothetical protein V499_00090 [Pseudogymnoascus sp. VKM F-103]|nr:hypothetical protein V499_00090 [Pseudogymnoascus sp. VKM F-103]
MSNSTTNSTSCSSITPTPFFDHSCALLAPPGSSLEKPSALYDCCQGTIFSYGDSNLIDCYAYCNATGVKEARDTESCLKDYFSARPDTKTVWKCNTVDNGAAVQGRASGWGGLVVLGLVVSVVTTMV